MTQKNGQSKKLGLFAGEGELPVKIAQTAQAGGWDLFVYAIDKGTVNQLKAWVDPSKLRLIRPFMADQNARLLHQDGVKHAVFAGKINKWSLLKAPLMDSRAMKIWQDVRKCNDDALMLTLLAEFDKEGIAIERQTDFLQDYFIQAGVYSKRAPSENEQLDIQYGFSMAKEMGRLDIGQTVVICNRMVIAIEAIEGTDQAILRSKRWIGKKGGTVVKVEKPNQDRRFDVPTVGPRTLSAMKKAGLNVLAVEAGKTFVLELEQMIKLVDTWQMTLIAV
jgi:UDP-2,3-diacylglucosamine hydrolase